MRLFVENEAKLRELIFPGAAPTEEECIRSQPIRKRKRESFRKPDYIHSTSESEIEQNDIPAIVRRKS